MFAISSRPRPLDFGRHAGLIDHKLMTRSSVSCAGTGGAAGVLQVLVRSGIGKVLIVDFDACAPTNPTTQAHDHADIGRSKVDALARRLLAINPEVEVRSHHQRYEDLSPADHAEFWSADVALAMTDSFATQCRINRDALATCKDTFFATCYIGCTAVEITATLFPLKAGCHRCHTKARYDAYEHGFVNPRDIPSHALAAEYLNSLIAVLVVSRLHQRAGSTLAIAEVVHEFVERPCLISRIIPSFGAAAGEAFAHRTPRPFTTSVFALDTPEGWVCPDCCTRGVVAGESIQPAPPELGPEPTHGRR